MKVDRPCIYRARTNSSELLTVVPIEVYTGACTTCTILRDQKAQDDACYNSDLTEKTCPISPQTTNTVENIG